MGRGGSAYETLLRLRRHRVQEIGGEIAELNAQIEAHRREKAEIAERLTERADPAFPEAARFTADHVRNINALTRARDRQIEDLSARGEEAAARLRDAFLDQKQVEILLDGSRATAARAAARREAAEAEEAWRPRDDAD